MIYYITLSHIFYCLSSCLAAKKINLVIHIILHCWWWWWWWLFHSKNNKRLKLNSQQKRKFMSINYEIKIKVDSSGKWLTAYEARDCLSPIKVQNAQLGWTRKHYWHPYGHPELQLNMTMLKSQSSISKI